jgi:hypothetical protein
MPGITAPDYEFLDFPTDSRRRNLLPLRPDRTQPLEGLERDEQMKELEI